MQLRFSRLTKLGAGTSSALLLLAALLVLFGAPTSQAATGQDGAVDPTFKSGSGPDHVVTSSAVQSDGKIVIGGYFSLYDNYNHKLITRLNPDGTVDPTFNPDSGANSNDDHIRAIALQSDGKIVIVGTFTSYNGIPRNRIARLNPDGRLDTTFDPGTGFSSIYVDELAIQNDGKILVGGSYSSYNGIARSGLVRLNPDGSLDATFNVVMTSSDSASYISAMALQTDGKLVIAGNFTALNGTASAGLARLNVDGSLDTGFDAGNGRNGETEFIKIQNNGKILIGGSFTSHAGVSRKYVARLNTNGSLDTSFNPATPDKFYVSAIGEEGNGKVLLVSYLSTYGGASHNRITRLNNDGSLDTTFNPGIGADEGINTLALFNNGKILIGGEFENFNETARSKIALLNNDGSLDTTFNADGSGANGLINAMEVQSDDKIVIGGRFSKYNGGRYGFVVRLNSDGRPDPTFNTGNWANKYIYAVAAQNNGKILIGGVFRSYNGTTRNGLARLNLDGSLDTTFNTDPSNVLPSVSKIKVQNDGKILFGGAFNKNGFVQGKLVRYNEDGTLDPTFTPGESVGVTGIALQSDRKILVSGIFTTYNGIARKGIARLNPDGSLDTTFNPAGGPDDTIYSLEVQSDGKILIGGLFTSYNGTPRNHIARLNPDGSLDTAFNSHNEISGTVWATKELKDGKIIAVGAFTALLNGITQKGIARLNPDGSLDTTFDVGKGADGLVRAVGVQSTGKIVVAGWFGAINNYKRDGIARLENNVSASVTLSATPNPAVLGESIIFTATVTPITATGTVRFTFGDSTHVTRTLINGTASYVTNTLLVGTTPVKATYSGDSTLQGNVSAVYNQVVVASCNPLVVTNPTDDGQATTCGTFSYALVVASSGMSVTFALTNISTITFTGSLTPTVKVGVAIDGGANGVVLNGNDVGGDGLRLGGNNKLINLTIRRFAGRELIATDATSGNRLYNVRIER